MISTENILSLDGSVWRFQDMVPKALLAALILAATSSTDPSSEPRSLVVLLRLALVQLQVVIGEDWFTVIHEVFDISSLVSMKRGVVSILRRRRRNG